MELRPDVIVDFIFEDGVLMVAVSNIGSGPAEDVRVRFHPSFKGLGGSVEIGEMPLFQNIGFLAPAKAIRTLLDSSAAYFNRDEPDRITAVISFRDRSGNEHTSTIRHDLSIYRDIAFTIR